MRACARVTPDKARETLFLPLARHLATPLSPLKRAKAVDKLAPLLLPVPGQRGMQLVLLQTLSPPDENSPKSFARL